MRYWLDTEFIEDGKTIDLLSIGIVCEDGREFYRQFLDADWTKANDWVKENVLPQLAPTAEFGTEEWNDQGFPWGSHGSVAYELRQFCNPEKYGKPEFWGYYADYDWVALCQLFGTMIDLPKGWPMYCRDIKQWCDELGNPKLPEQGKGEHHALADAKWNLKAWVFLEEMSLS
jgi:hypothetical protein